MASVQVIGALVQQGRQAESANNRLKCQILPAMSGGGTPPQLVDRVKDGVDDLVITLPGYTAGRFPMMEVFELPFMTNSAEVGARAAWDYLQKNATQGVPGHQDPRHLGARRRLRAHARQAGQDPGRLQGPEDARAHAPDQQVAGRAGRQPGGNAGAGGARCDQQGHDRRLPAALGDHARRSSCRSWSSTTARPIRAARPCTAPASSSR